MSAFMPTPYCKQVENGEVVMEDKEDSKSPLTEFQLVWSPPVPGRVFLVISIWHKEMGFWMG